jgi:hypothetical protein
LFQELLIQGLLIQGLLIQGGSLTIAWGPEEALRCCQPDQQTGSGGAQADQCQAPPGHLQKSLEPRF